MNSVLGREDWLCINSADTHWLRLPSKNQVNKSRPSQPYHIPEAATQCLLATQMMPPVPLKPSHQNQLTRYQSWMGPDAASDRE